MKTATDTVSERASSLGNKSDSTPRRRRNNQAAERNDARRCRVPQADSACRYRLRYKDPFSLGPRLQCFRECGA